MQISETVKRIIFPCEKKLNEKLDTHKKEVEKLIATIKKDGYLKKK